MTTVVRTLAFLLLSQATVNSEVGALQEGPAFTDTATSAGLVYNQWYREDPSEELKEVPYMTGGVAVGDFNSDGWPDVFATRYHENAILFKNLGNGRFEDVTTNSEIETGPKSNGAAWGDIDNDGDLDLYVTFVHAERYALFINNGGGVFTEDAAARGADVSNEMIHDGFGASFGDFDRDGWLDFHVTEWGKRWTRKFGPAV